MNPERIFAVCYLLASLAMVVVVGAAVDMVLYHWFGVPGTISRAMQYLGEAAPIFPFLVGALIFLTVGVLAGHFWWPQPPLSPP